ncbi:BspA family leucine-rich repeat surface protein [Helicobacter sp. CLO-3]|uniref:BspA family leucine-rich repeat surface protein n=1 Tax=Helicobacter sp. CLO-3 TaxID=211 RepID=UPI0012E98D55|nr:BspA family leucine-rich repeat surface protein [Helicobacter sp. CLO-3]
MTTTKLTGQTTMQNPKNLQNTSEAWNLKMPNLKKLNLKNLAFISIAALGLMFSACAINTNPLTDKSKHKYHPQNRDELVALLKDENIKLDTIDTSKIKDMSFLFSDISDEECDKMTKNRDCAPYIKNGKNTARTRKDFSGIETWDVSNATNMDNMFSGAKSFNKPLDSWSVSNVTNMKSMFYRAESFNQPLDSWDVSNVADMSGMFCFAKSFNQPLDSWDVSKVESMKFMFATAISFNQPLNKWNVGNVADMKYMFARAISFNQPLDSWDVSKVKDMHAMFYDAESFNQNLDSWNVNKGTKREYMFKSSPLQSNPPKWYKKR